MSNVTLSSNVVQTYVTTARGRVASVSLTVTLTDVRPYVVFKTVGLVVDWGDGSQADDVEGVPSPYVDTFVHTYIPGNYILKLTARNYALPLAEVQVATHDVVVAPLISRVPTLAELGLEPIIFGPILPRDEGFPNASEWSFHSAQDSVLLESSARLLLTTVVGERLMMPDYGTALPLMIFDPSSPPMTDAIQQEVVRAFSVHEPRLAVQGVDVTGVGTKLIRVAISLLSKLDQRKFEVSTSFIKS